MHLLPTSAELTPHEAASGILGSISLSSWIFLTLPQLLENYSSASADGISLLFLTIWLAGDIANLVGAVWAGLVPTVIALGGFFVVSDGVLIGQVLYYRGIKRRKGDGEGERQALLVDGGQGRRRESQGLPGSTTSRRKSSRRSERRSSLDALLSTPTPWSTVIKNIVSVLAVVVVGTAGWAVMYRTGAWRPTPTTPAHPPGGGHDDSPGDGVQRGPLGAEILGYMSAVAYLGARIPQIVKNQRERSCEGLSLLFFVLSLMGNLTYGGAILAHSVEKQYFLTNLPWLIGSLGTMAEDVAIFVQFSMFGDRGEETAVE